jgi:hypothetical protein
LEKERIAALKKKSITEEELEAEMILEREAKNKKFENKKIYPVSIAYH